MSPIWLIPRSGTVRKLTENVILRGVRGVLCKYHDSLIPSCLQLLARAILSSHRPSSGHGHEQLALMASQPKVYEVLGGVKQRGVGCDYVFVSHGSYQQLLDAPAGYGTLANNCSSVVKRRADMDLLYYKYRTSPESHKVWRADSKRSLFHPGHHEEDN